VVKLSLESSFIANFFKLSAINICSNLMVPIATLLDVAFLGHLSDVHHLAGVAIAALIFNYLQ
jgi:MATE family multidrug resistance protein